MTAAEMIRAMDLYRELSGRPLVETPPAPATTVVAEPEAPPAAEAPEKPVAGTDATVTSLDVTRKRP
jgi:hypothetical protein